MSNNNFYTSIETKGNHILYRGYENGERVSKKIPYKPTLFIPTKEATDWKSFGGKPVEKKQFESIIEFKEYIKTYSEISNIKLYGCENIIRQYTSDTFKGEIAWDFNLVQTWFYDIETETENGFPEPELAEERILLITMGHKNTNHLITWSWKDVDKEVVMSEIDKDYTWEYRQFDDEKAMLSDFVMFWRTTHIDVYSGWFSNTFDNPYLVNRISKILGDGFVQHLSPWKNVSERTVLVNGKQKPTFDISGITHLDMLDLYKKFNPGSQESWKLDYIANAELGEGKKENPGDSFKEFYTNHWNCFCSYNIIDVILLMKLDNKKKCIQLALTLAYLAKTQFDDITSAMRLWESIIHNYFYDQNIAEDLKKVNKEKKQIVGAYVHEPRPGGYGWSISLDCASLYPSLMMQQNISPECIHSMSAETIESILENRFKVPDGLCLSGNGLLTTTDTIGFIPVITKRFFDLRNETKVEMLLLKKNDPTNPNIASLDMKQSSVKVALNSLYGCTAMQFFKYYDSRLAEAVTSTGQVILKSAMNYLNEIINKILKTDNIKYVFYGDTDSMYITMENFVEKFGDGKTNQEIVTFLEKFVFQVIQPELNKKLAELVSSLGAKDNKINFKLECIGPKLIMLSKKKYAFDILYSEGIRYQEPLMKVMGIEIVRSSTPGVVKDYLKNALEIVMRKDEQTLQEYIATVKTSFMKKTHKEIAFPRGVNGMTVYEDDANIYKSKTPIHVRGALLYNMYIRKLGLENKYSMISDGDKIKFIMLKMPNPLHENVIAFPDKLPAELGLDKYVDNKLQYVKTFLDPIERIITCLGWTSEEIITL